MMPEDIRFLIEAGHKAPSADNSQPWKFFWDGEYLTIRYAVGPGKPGVFDERHPAVSLTLGAVAENIDQAAAANEIDIKWDLPANHKTNPLTEIRAKIGPSEPKKYQNSQLPLFSRHTNRHPFKTKALPADLINDLQSMIEGDSTLVVFDNRQSIKQLAHLIKESSKIRFQIQELHEWLAASLRFTPEQVSQGDGLDVKTIHLPPGGALLLKAIGDWSRMQRLNKFGAFKLFSAIEAGLFRKAGAIVGVVSQNPDSAAISAGRLMERVWIMLNRNGIAVHPNFVLTDQLYRLSAEMIPPMLVDKAVDLKNRSQEVLQFDENKLLMLLRVGYPTQQPVLSKRVPLEALLADA